MKLRFLRLGIVFSSILLMFVAGYLVKNHIRPYSIISVLEQDDPIYLRYQQHLQKYNDENDLYLLLESPTSLLQNKEFRKILDSLTGRLKKIPNLENISSLSDLQYLSVQNKTPLFKRFFEQPQLDREGLSLLTQSSLYQYSYLSPDGKASMIYLKLRAGLNPQELKQTLGYIDFVQAILKAENPAMSFHLLGTEVARNYFVQEIIKSQARILPVILLVILLLLYGLFRNWRICALALYVMGMSYFCTVILIILTEGSINPFSSFALLFILVISTVDIVHLFSAVGNTPGNSVTERFRKAIQHIWTPCFICAVTTWIGLLSLVFSDIKPIRNFGIDCAFGVAICFFLTFFVVPWLVKVFAIEIRKTQPIVKFGHWQVFGYISLHRKKIVGLYIALILGLGYFSYFLKADDNLYKKFIASHPLSQATQAFDHYFHFTGSLDLVITAERNLFLERKIEKDLADLQAKLRALGNVAHIKSIGNYLHYIRALYPKKPPSANFSTDPDFQQIFYLLDDFSVFDPYLPAGQNESRLVIYLKSMDTSALIETKKQIEALLQTTPLPKGLSWSIEGFSTVRAAIFASIFSGFIKSFLIDFLGIFLCFLLFFKSWTWSLLALIPNTLPLIAVGGLMQLFDMTVDYNLIVLVAIVFGICVDDTTHFLYYLLQHFRQNNNLAAALDFSLKETSVALVSATFIFSVTLPAFFLTDILMFSQVALILILTLLLGLSGDLLVLPALLLSKRLQSLLGLTTKPLSKGSSP